MTSRKFLNIALSVLVLTSFLFGSISQTQPAAAMPTGPTDETKVPHYFGPYPNWANSPFTLPDVKVTIAPPGGTGTTAEATATIGANGAVTGLTITNPGSGYTANALVTITKANGTAVADPASAVATFDPSGVVTGVNVTTKGAGYTKPTVVFSGGGALPISATATPAPTRIFSVSAGNANGGTFLLVVNGINVGPFAWNAADATIASALSTAGFSAAVSGGTGPWVVTFGAAPTSFSMDSTLLTRTVPAPVTGAGASPAAIDTFSVSAGNATGGSFTLSVDAATTGAIAWNAAAADVQTALTNAGVATTSVSGSGPWVIVFATPPTSVSINGAGLTQAATGFGATVGGTADTYNVSAGNATGGSFTLSVDAATTGAIAWNAAAADVQTALTNAGVATTSVSGSGTAIDPWVIVFTTEPLLVTMDGALLTQAATGFAATGVVNHYNVSAGDANGGSFLLSVDAATTGAIAWNAAALDVQNALSLASVSATVTGTGPWFVTFFTAPASVAMDSAGLTRTVPDPIVGAGWAALPTDTYNVSISNANGGTFTLSVDAATTGAIAWNATALAVQTALNALAGVSSTVSGSGSIATPWVITFAAAPGSVTINGAGLTQPALVGATATAFGGVDGLTITNLGSVAGYHLPTVSFDMPDDPNGTIAEGRVICETMVNGQCANPLEGGTLDVVTITGIEITSPGSGYSSAPNVAVLDGTQFEPAPSQPGDPLLVPATVASTISVDTVTVDTFGSGYASVPSVDITDPGTPITAAVAQATTTVGAITGFTGLVPGSGYITASGIKKFQDDLPGVCDPTGANAPACPDWTNNPAAPKAIPLAVSTPATISGQAADTYEIGLVQYRTSFSSSMPDTLVRGYVQIDTGGVPGSQSFPLTNTLWDSATSSYFTVPVLINGVQAYGVTAPQWLGPTIVAGRDKAVRIVFRNLLPTGSQGDLFIPTDTTIMGSGMGPLANQTPVTDAGTVMDGVRNPMCTEGYMGGMPNECFTQNRATLHLHGGVTPWISDGTPHQWITPANENTGYPQGVSVSDVPDMNVCKATDDGCQTFYYTNQQSARLMFYHDHAWGITRLNVYAGEAAGYLLTDGAEQGLITGSGALASLDNPSTVPNEALGIPLVIQDRTFVPSDEQLYGAAPGDPLWSQYGQDPTWDKSRWGGKGNFWYHHVYMPAQNPGDPSGMSAFGRWMYGPWFWPPASPLHPPIDNPYYDPLCDLNDPSTWAAHGYQTDPFCEPKLIPGTPNISVGMEQFNDTPIVNGIAYPKVTLDPKSYRFRILNAANDRFWNLQWYVADATGTEVALDPLLLAAAQTDPVVFPTPVHNASTDGPDWIQIGSEGGFLPAPVVVNGQQETTWITDPTRFDVGNVDLHSLLLAPAERADVVVDFSRFPAGTKLILYNDAPAAFPARVPSYDYYTGAPDLRPVGAPTILPGYGPNTRTIMQVTISGAPSASAFNLNALRSAFTHKANGSGVFESSQDPIIVGQAAYNSAYGKSFVGAGWCNDPTLDPASAAAKRCDGYARIQEGNKPADLFGFNSLRTAFAPGVGKVQIPFQPKGLHDEMNSTAFDEFGRMQANLGLEAPNANPLLQNIILYPYVNPSTELVDATNLPRNDVVYNADGTVASDVKITPIASASDGTQIWKMTHNGVDTHPIHWHLWNVQVLNRVSWDNIILPPDPAELGWKETVRVSPLQDTIVALRPIIPEVPFELPNSARPLNPMMPWTDMAPGVVGSTLGFNNVDPNGNPTTPIVNSVVNFGWEYVYHCHILSHEEMDMMRPISVMLPPNAPDGLTFDKATATLTWNDNSINETSFLVQRSDYNNGTWSAWADVGTSPSPLGQPNTHGTLSLVDPSFDPFTDYQYRVVAQNTVGYGAEFPIKTVQSVSAVLTVLNPPRAPSGLTATYQAAPMGFALSWMDNATNETGYRVLRSDNGGASFATLATLAANSASYLDTAAIALDHQYQYQVAAFNTVLPDGLSNIVTVFTPPNAPTSLAATYQYLAGPQVVLSWNDPNTYETGYRVERCAGAGCTNFAQINGDLAQNSVSFTDTTVAFDQVYSYRVYAFNATGNSGMSPTASVTMPPLAPTGLTATFQAATGNPTWLPPRVALSWVDNSATETGYVVERCSGVGCINFAPINGGLPAGSTSFTDNTPLGGTTYSYRVKAVNGGGDSLYSNTASLTTPAYPLAPSPVGVACVQQGNNNARCTLTWTDVANNTSYTVQWATDVTFTTGLVTPNANQQPGANAGSYQTPNIARNTDFWFRIRSNDANGSSAWTIAAPAPVHTP